MRRPIMFLAGLLLTTGAGIALAGPAQAAPATPGHGAAAVDFPFGDDYEYNLDYNSYDLDYEYNLDYDQKVNSCNSSNVGLTLISWTC